MFHNPRIMAMTAVFTVGLAMVSCSPEPEMKTEINTTGSTEIEGPNSIHGYPPETPRMTVKLTGSTEMDNVQVNLFDVTGQLVASSLTTNGIAFFPLGDTVATGFHRITIDGYTVTDPKVSMRNAVSEHDDAARAAQEIATVFTAEEAILLFGEGDHGGLNRVATHKIPSALAYEFSLYKGQIIHISPGDRVESGMVKIDQMYYSSDGQWVTIATDNANTLDMMSNAATQPKKKEESDKDTPFFVTGNEIMSKEVESHGENSSVAFSIPHEFPVISATIKLEKNNEPDQEQ